MKRRRLLLGGSESSSVLRQRPPRVLLSIRLYDIDPLILQQGDNKTTRSILKRLVQSRIRSGYYPDVYAPIKADLKLQYSQTWEHTYMIHIYILEKLKGAR
jgi:hypothetical protein